MVVVDDGVVVVDDGVVVVDESVAEIFSTGSELSTSIVSPEFDSSISLESVAKISSSSTIISFSILFISFSFDGFVFILSNANIVNIVRPEISP